MKTNLLIILGAGASHGYIGNYKATLNSSMFGLWQPPLTDNIFDKKINYTNVMNDFPEIGNLVSIINIELNNEKLKNENIEQIFGRLLNDAIKKQKPERLRQLIALRFYLWKLFGQISDNFYQKGNNHGYILDKLNDKHDEDPNYQVAIVNFNYDTLLEKSLPGFFSGTNNAIYRYSRDYIKMFKPHGSHNWYHLLAKVGNNDDIDKEIQERGVYGYLIDNPELIYNRKDSVFQLFSPAQFGDGTFDNELRYVYNDGRVFYLYPAITIPTIGKDNHDMLFPNEDKEKLKGLINNTDRILIIGWKAGDEYFVEFLSQNLIRPVKLTVVSGGSSSAVVETLKDKKIDIESSDVSITQYSDYVESGKIDTIL